MASFGNFDAPFRVQSQLFQPPRTPRTPSSSSYSYRESPEYSGTRKRARRVGPAERSPARDLFTSSTDLESPAPLVNTDYILANGGEDQQKLDLTETKEKLVEELDYRPNRYRQNTILTSTEQATDKDTGNRKRSRSEAIEPAMPLTPSGSAATPGWGRAVFTVVGKVWDFCWTSAFRGFSAGGGQTYTMGTPSSRTPDTSTWQMVHNQDHMNTSNSRSKSASTPVPGQYPEDEVEVEQGRDRETWVLVPESPSARHSSPRGESPTQFARKVPRRSSAYRLQPRRSGAGLARVANKRPSLAPIRPPVGATLSSAAPSTPTKLPSSPTKSTTQTSPASKDAQRYAAKFRRREREEDASIQKMNDQLKALIREGREALGSRVEIDDMDLDDE